MHFNPTIYLASIESKQVPAMPCKKALTPKPRPNCPRIHPRQLHSLRGILTLLILNTCQSGEKATAAFFGKGGFPQSGFRAIMAK
jgi:hypothetical protein